MLEGLLLCFGDSDGAPCPLVSAPVVEVAPVVEASPPSYFVSDIPFIFPPFKLIKTIQDIMIIDKLRFRDEGQLV